MMMRRAGGSGRVFWSSWRVLGGILGGLGGLLGRLGVVLGDLGRSWDHLGSPWVALSRFGLVGVRRAGKRMFQKEAKMEPKWEPKYAKIEHKTDQNRRQKRRRKKKLLKIVLERSWGDLGSSGEVSWGRRMGFRHSETAFRENQAFKEVRLQEATWAELGPTWAPKRVQKGFQNGA